MKQYLKKRCVLLLAATMIIMSIGNSVLAASKVNYSNEVQENYRLTENDESSEDTLKELSLNFTTINKMSESKKNDSYEYEVSNDRVIIKKYLGEESEIKIPDTIDGYPVTEIDDGAFRNCKSLKAVSFSKNTWSIGNYAFAECKLLESVIMNDSLPSIEDGCFMNCTNLSKIYFPKELQYIGAEAFKNCNKLKNIVLPDGLERLGQNSFGYCTALEKIHIPANTQFLQNPFSYCSKLTKIIVDTKNNCMVLKDDCVYYFSDLMNKYDLVTCPAGKEGSVKIITGLYDIAECAFAGCDKVDEIIVPEDTTYGLKCLEFDECTNLKKVTINSKNKYLKSVDGIVYSKNGQCLKYCPPGISGKFKIPEGVTSLDVCFSNCAKLTEITIPSTVKDITKWVAVGLDGQSVFNGCSSLTSINVNDKNPVYKSINGAVYSKNGKKLYIVPAGKKNKFIIPESVEYIEDHAFDSCGKLTQITIPQSVKKIGGAAFVGCLKLESFDVDSRNTYFCSKSGVLYDFKQTTLISCPSNSKNIDIPASVSTIAYNAFYECAKLKNVDLPSGVKKLDKGSVVNCTFNLYFNSNTVPDFVDHEYMPTWKLWLRGSDYNKHPIGYYFESLKAWKDTITKEPDFAGITWKKASGTPTISSAITLDKAVLSLTVKSSVSLKASVFGNNSNKTVTWSTSDKSVATVSSKGVVTAKAVGTATITAKNNGKTATCKVTVTPAQPKLKKAASSERGKIKITWEKASGADGYVIYKKSGKSWKKLASVSGASTVSYTDKGLTSGKKYTYSVAAYKKSGKTTYTSSYNKTGVSAKVK